MEKKIAGLCKGHPTVRHTTTDGKKCGGQLAINGSGTFKIPHGFGYRGKKFLVDQVQYAGYSGFCLKCKTQGIFIREDVKAKSSTKRIMKFDVKNTGRENG